MNLYRGSQQTGFQAGSPGWLAWRTHRFCAWLTNGCIRGLTRKQSLLSWGMPSLSRTSALTPVTFKNRSFRQQCAGSDQARSSATRPSPVGIRASPPKLRDGEVTEGNCSDPDSAEAKDESHSPGHSSPLSTAAAWAH
ncbi:hypothetical protein NN561_011003 [Cricetulus griseus]